MLRLPLCPLQSSYSAKFGNGLLVQQTAGGLPRMRRDIIGAPHSVSASYLLQELDYQRLLAFYRIWQRNPAPFVTKLIIDDPVYRDYTVQFVPESISLQAKQGKTYSVAVQFVVLPQTEDAEFDQFLLESWDTGLTPQTLDNLDKLVNVKLPDALEKLPNV